MKLSVCIDAIFRGLPPVEAMRRVRGAGYDAYEFWGWWDKDLDAMIDAQRALGLIPAAMCTRFFSLADPAGHEDYLLGLEESIRDAMRLGCGTLILPVRPGHPACRGPHSAPR
jgi:hydroxypyruvate isomerase